MKKLFAVLFSISLSLSLLVLGGEPVNAAGMSSSTQVGYIKRKSKKVYVRTKHGTRYVAHKTKKGTKWTAHKTKRGTKTAYVKTKRTTKKTYNNIKN